MKSKKAFTLIELLIVIAIIGVLAAALYPTIRDAIARGRDGGREGDLNNIAVAIEAYNADYGTYPTTTGCIDGSTVFVDPADGVTPVTNDYFKGGKPPVDPSPNRTTGLTGAAATCIDAGNYYFKPFGGSDGVEYILVTVMESPRNNNFDGDPDATFATATYTLEGEEYYVRVQ